MKRGLFLLLALVLWLPGSLRAQDAEALAALVGVLKEVDDPLASLVDAVSYTHLTLPTKA